MICQKCGEVIRHRDEGDMVVDVRVRGERLRMVFCLKCADELVLSKLEEGE